MKKTIISLLTLGTTGCVVTAAPFLAIGDNAELFVTADTNVSYNDNLTLAPKGSELSDSVFVLKPGVDLKFGKDSAVKGDFIAAETLSSYADNVNLNNQLFGTGLNAAYDNDRVKLQGNVSYNGRDQATANDAAALNNNQGKLLEHYDTAAGLNGEFRYSEKISFGTGVNYSNTDYKSAAAVESKDYSVPVNVYYELTPKVDVSTGLTYTHTELSGVTGNNADIYDAYYYNVGARGTFTPKLSGSFSVGYNTRHANVGPDENGSLGSKADLVYAYSEKTQLTFNVNRDFSNATSGGSSFQSTDFSLGATSALTVDWSVNAGVSYRMMEYANSNPSFTNNYYEGTLGAAYTINAYLSAGLSYVYRDQTSNTAAREFTNNVVSLSLSARY
jgi:polysaccharide biosynthesis protein VpsM